MSVVLYIMCTLHHFSNQCVIFIIVTIKLMWKPHTSLCSLINCSEHLIFYSSVGQQAVLLCAYVIVITVTLLRELLLYTTFFWQRHLPHQVSICIQHAMKCAHPVNHHLFDKLTTCDEGCTSRESPSVR